MPCWTVQEYDPLEAFMAEINAEIKEPTAATAAPKPDMALACDEEADPAVEYMEVMKGVAGGVVSIACWGLRRPMCPMYLHHQLR